MLTPEPHAHGHRRRPPAPSWDFDGRLTVCPTRDIQPTPTMMVVGAVQAVRALDAGVVGTLELDPPFCGWVGNEFRTLLGDRAGWLDPPPDEAW